MKVFKMYLKKIGKIKKPKVFGLMILGFFHLLFHTGCSGNKSKLPNDDAIRDAVHRSADYLRKIAKQNGMFVYRINMDSTIKLKDKYNILRHSGAVYSLSMYYDNYPDENIKSAISRTGKYLQEHSIFPVNGLDNMLAVWSKPEVNGSSQPLQAKLGGTGIGLVALLSIEKLSPGFTPLKDLKALGRFIIYMQKQNGSFYSKYIPSLGGRQDKWNSLYYPGEAALGLLMLYEMDSSVIWLKSAQRALEYLAHSRKYSNTVPADHWALLATEKILSCKQSPKLSVNRTLLINHAIQICEAMLQDQINDSRLPAYNGGFTIDGRTTPTATRLEGLIAALSYLPPDHKLWKRMDTSIARGISFLLLAQIKKGKYSGAMPRAIGIRPGKSKATIKFNKRSTEVRIDYVQHAMCAMIQYQNTLKRQR